MRIRFSLFDDVSTPYLRSTLASYEHVPSLDGLRAVSIIAVMFTHFIFPHGPGGYGVFLFFIISGFLITRLLFAEQKIQKVDLKAFYIRRVFRLYPVLLVLTLTAIIVGQLLYRNFDFGEVGAALFYYSNFLIVHKELNNIPWQMNAFQVFWSLSVEEHFYIAFPFLFVLLRTPVKILMLALFVVVACTIGRYTMAVAHPELISTHYFGMLTQYRIDSIALGVALAALCEMPSGNILLRQAGNYFVMAIALAVLIAGFAFLRDPALKTALRWPLLGFPILVFTSAIIFSPKYRVPIAILNHPVMVWTGKLSYSLYVWHVLAGYAAFALVPNAPGAALAIIFAYLLATGSYFLVERPMIAVGRRIRHKHRERVPVTGLR